MVKQVNSKYPSWQEFFRNAAIPVNDKEVESRMAV